MKKKQFFLRIQIILGIVSILFIRCKNEINTEWEGILYPSHFSKPIQKVIDSREFTKNGFLLGKKLFYDPILSKDSSISCGSCHNQSTAFSDLGHSISKGINGQLGIRNAPALQNLIWQPSYFHDGGVVNIDMISLAPIENPLEMDENINRIITKLNQHPEYPQLFERVFGTNEINSGRILTAITQFQAKLISANSRYDQFIEGKYALSAEELDGKFLFENKCSNCHSGVLFSDFEYRNNGISDTMDKDLGRYRISVIDSDKQKFKTPSLRNIEVTGPYMHNGQYTTLEDVLEHYNSGVKPSPTLDENLKNGIKMTKLEQQKIIIFLKTLTDTDFLNDIRFSK